MLDHPYIPDQAPLATALKRTTHLGVGAHPDDLEFMALHGILECYAHTDRWFTGVTCTDGRRAPQTGADQLSSDELVKTRADEQKLAAKLGQYSSQYQLGFQQLTNASECSLLAERLRPILEATRPTVIYTHNPADRHPTHLAVVLATIEAIRTLPTKVWPKKLFGCEVWRDLDWLPQDHKVVLDVSKGEALGRQLTNVFKSQIVGGKRYDRAVDGRRLANATFSQYSEVDHAERLTFAIDLIPLLQNPHLSVLDFTLAQIELLKVDVREAFAQFDSGTK